MKLAHRIDGEGQDLVLVHAGVADLRMWDPLVALLADRFRCVRCDLRGHGDSVPDGAPYSDADDLAGLLDELGLERPLVVGASFGGLVALWLAAVRPVAGLVLLDPPLPDHEWSDAMQEFFAEEERLAEAGEIDAAVALNVDRWSGGADRDLIAQMQRRALELQLADEGEVSEPDLDLLAIGVPVTVGYGTEDVADFVAIAHRLAEELPDATLHPIAGAGHLPAMEQPAAVAELIVRAARRG